MIIKILSNSTRLALLFGLLHSAAQAEQLTRYEVINEWLVECQSSGIGADELCTVRSGPHVARTEDDVSGFTLLVDPKQGTLAIKSQTALGLEAKVDGGEVFSTACASPLCSFSEADTSRLLSQLTSGSVLVARVVTSKGDVSRSLHLRDFRKALSSAKQTRRAFPADRLGTADMLAVQALLSDLGYDPGPRDGLLGPKTRRAIIDYQRDNSLDPNGRPTKDLLFFLRSDR